MSEKFFTADENGNAFVDHLSIQNGESYTVMLPQNATYCVTEAAGQYTSSYSITDSAGLNKIKKSSDYNSEENKALSTLIETADPGENVTIVFTNVSMITKKLVLEKVLENSSDDNADRFNFTVSLAGLEEGYKLNTSFGRLIADSDGTASLELSLAQNGKFEIENVPINATYKIREDVSDYLASYVIFHESTSYSYTYASGSSPVPGIPLSTGTRSMSQYYDSIVRFTNRKVACDITITKQVDMTYGLLLENQYENDEFVMDVVLNGLTEGKKYNEINVEYLMANTTGSIKKTLADVLGLSQEDAEAVPTSANFTITLHHGESFKIRSLPYGASCLVTERASMPYIASYTVTGNEGAVIQASPGANTVINQSLAMNTPEVVDASDKDIVITFSNQFEFQPYTLPAAGATDKRMAILLLTALFFITGSTYIYTNRRKRRSK